MKIFTALSSGLALLSSHVEGKAYFQTRSELITKATVIAIIDLQEPQAAKADPSRGKVDPFANTVTGKIWRYSTQSKATLITVIKGEPPKTFTLYGGESFVCAQCNLAKGRFLAFLTKDGDYWSGSNWHLSLRPIKDEKVEWHVSEEQRWPMEYQNLAKVTADINAILSKNANCEQCADGKTPEAPQSPH